MTQNTSTEHHGENGYWETLAAASSAKPVSEDHVAQVLRYFMLTPVLFTAAKLKLADHLQDKSLSSGALARSLNLPEQSLNTFETFLDILTTISVLKRTTEGEGAYRLTEFGEQFQSDHPHSLYGTYAILDLFYHAWGNLYQHITTGQSGFELAYQQSVYSYLEKHPDAGEQFHQFLALTTPSFILPALDAYDFSKAKHVVDLGGSTGAVSQAILERYPHLAITIFDEPHVIESAKNQHQGLEQCTVLGGNFLDSIPVTADVFLLARVLNNWNDEDALLILKNVLRSLEAGGTIVVVEPCTESHNSTADGLFQSLHIQLLGSTPVRTPEQYIQLLTQAGFKEGKVLKLFENECCCIQASAPY